jgi:hypothetical protein
LFTVVRRSLYEGASGTGVLLGDLEIVNPPSGFEVGSHGTDIEKKEPRDSNGLDPRWQRNILGNEDGLKAGAEQK